MPQIPMRMIPIMTMSVWLKRCASRTRPPIPGRPLMVSAATIVVNAKSTATRMPVMISGRCKIRRAISTA